MQYQVCVVTKKIVPLWDAKSPEQMEIAQRVTWNDYQVTPCGWYVSFAGGSELMVTPKHPIEVSPLAVTQLTGTEVAILAQAAMEKFMMLVEATPIDQMSPQFTAALVQQAIKLVQRDWILKIADAASQVLEDVQLERQNPNYLQIQHILAGLDPADCQYLDTPPLVRPKPVTYNGIPLE